jgi:hypothetical protein
MDWNELGVVSKEEYKSYVMTILNADSIRIDDASEQRYGGSDSFGGMSKDIGRQWKQADALTKTVFKELAKENMERHKKVQLQLLFPCTILDSTSSSQTLFCTHHLFRRSMKPTKPSPRSFRILPKPSLV